MAVFHRFKLSKADSAIFGAFSRYFKILSILPAFCVKNLSIAFGFVANSFIYFPEETTPSPIAFTQLAAGS